MKRSLLILYSIISCVFCFAQQYSPYAEWEQTAVEEPQAHTDSFVVVVNPNIYTWLSVDPLADKYPNISSYTYCAWNPIKNIDPNGKWIETLWDAANVAMDVTSMTSNIREGNINDAIIDGIGLVLDVGATILPAVPGGAGTAIKAYRAADKVSDAAKLGKTIDKTVTVTPNTYRQALQKATGKLGKEYEAHHTLPQKYRKEFESLGINIDEPGYVVWRKTENHNNITGDL